MSERRAGERVVIPVASSGGGYEVHIGVGLLDQLATVLEAMVGARRVAVVSDDGVAALYGDRVLRCLSSGGFRPELLTFPAGERSKTRKSWSILTDAMLDAGLGRDSCVVAVGGGVTTDLAGFVAATFLRGVPVLQVPTSYLAMIDASVGGKTGVDVRHGKNLVGAFHAPVAVLVDPTVLETLPERERAEGLVEAFKHGAILDESYFTELEGVLPLLLDADPAAAVAAVSRSISLKARVVGEDEREAGYRQILNFGHTVGHALEAASDFSLGHGRAVAAGMVAEARLGAELGVTEPDAAARLARVQGRLFPDPLPPVGVDRVASYLAADKKTRSGAPRYVLLERIGCVSEGDGWSREVPEPLVMEILAGL